MRRQEIDNIIDRNEKPFEEISDQIWSFAETCYNEYQSSKLQSDFLREHGFRVEAPIAGLDTAFVAEWGEGGPVVAILGEYDALPGQSQAADALECTPVEADKPGHACGHNLLGTGGMEAACAVKEYLEAHHLAGRIRYYGCPAEENGSGKVFMILGGAFKDVDCAISWHPGARYGVNRRGMAIIGVRFRFEGVAAHAYAMPWAGRSALDAVELMNVAANFLREHVKPNTHLHYAITNAGGTAPNIVPSKAEVYYLLRCDNSEYLLEVYQRLLDIAKGAALMTSTKLEEPYIDTAMSTLIENDTLIKLTEENMMSYLPVDYTPEELEYALQYQKLGSNTSAECPMEQVPVDGMMGTCTDVCDVSWVTPLVKFMGATVAIGTPGHSWKITAQGKSPIAYRGMHTSAKIMANTAVDLMEDPALVEQAKKDFETRMKGKTYRTVLEGRTPPSGHGIV